MSGKVIKYTAAIGIELRYRSLRRTRQSARSAFIIKRDRCPSRLDAMIDFGRGNHESVPGKSCGCPNHRPGQLKYVRVKQDSRIATVSFRSSDKCSHRSSVG